MRNTFLGALLIGAGAALTAPVQADIVVTDVNLFRDLRGDNNLGFSAGDRILYGATVVGGSAGVSLFAHYEPTGFRTTPQRCGPLTVNPGFCASSTAFAAAPREGPWTYTFFNGDGETLNVTGPSPAGVDVAVPHPTSVTISGGGTTPTISWSLPAGYIPDGLRVNVYDRSRILANGTADIIHSTTLSPGATSYTLPETLSGGGQLTPGGQYAINFQVVETRDDVPFTGLQAQILSRANSYFNFSPLSGDPGTEVHLPTVSGGVFHFNVDEVGPDHITFIDPEVATGYEYATGAGDPNFASVLLPFIGDDLYELVYGGESFDLAAGVQYFFPEGGVSAFTVLGIETGAMLDPDDPLAFMTGLTFVTDGRFAGTMTPVRTSVDGTTVPTPAPLVLLSMGALAFVVTRRRPPAQLRGIAGDQRV